MGRRKLTISEVKERISQIHGDEITLDETTYVNTRTKARFIDKDYGEWWTLPSRIIHLKNSHPKRKWEKCRSTNLRKYGVENPLLSKEVREKIKITNLKKYGVENPLLSKEIQEKIKETNLKKYGVENPLESKEIQEKIKETNLARYGVENPLLSREIQDRVRETNIDRYGVENVFESEDIKGAIKKTNLRKYGAENPFQSDEIKERIRNKTLEIYGVEHNSQSPEIKLKKKSTSIKRYGVKHPMHDRSVALKAAKSSNNAHIIKHWKTNEDLICQGSYERKVVEYLNKNKIDYKWQHKTFNLTLNNGKESTYRPDLYLIGNKNPWVEIKGYFRKDAQEKWNIFSTQIKPNSQLWNEQKLKKIGIL